MNASIPLDRAALIRAINAGQHFKYLHFWGHAPRADGQISNSIFSQWFDAPFTVAGVRYATAEHWMMAAKARLFGDTATLEAILAAKSPGEAKALGRAVQPFDAARWRAACFAAVTEGNVHKFGADPARRSYLLATGDRVLVEASPRDRIWGIGLGAKNADASQPERWRGENLLGFALMAARERLRAA